MFYFAMATRLTTGTLQRSFKQETELSQCVSVNNWLSSHLSIISGPPQGSILGPLLFLVLINDLPSTITSQSLISILLVTPNASSKSLPYQIFSSFNVIVVHYLTGLLLIISLSISPNQVFIVNLIQITVSIITHYPNFPVAKI